MYVFKCRASIYYEVYEYRLLQTKRYEIRGYRLQLLCCIKFIIKIVSEAHESKVSVCKNKHTFVGQKLCGKPQVRH